MLTREQNDSKFTETIIFEIKSIRRILSPKISITAYRQDKEWSREGRCPKAVYWAFTNEGKKKDLRLFLNVAHS